SRSVGATRKSHSPSICDGPAALDDIRNRASHHHGDFTYRPGVHTSPALPLLHGSLTGSWSKGRSEYYAYYHCRPACRAVNVSKARLEGLFAEELALLQPTPGYMRLLKESVLRIWTARKAAVHEEIAAAERAAKAIQEKLDRLDEAFLFERS